MDAHKARFALLGSMHMHVQVKKYGLHMLFLCEHGRFRVDCANKFA